jgi:hypothetical protein
MEDNALIFEEQARSLQRPACRKPDMNKYIRFAACALILQAVLAGCGSSGDTGGNTEMDRMAAALNKPKPEPSETKPAEPAPLPAPAPAESAPAVQPPAPQYTAPEEITADDPQRGRVFRNQPGYYNALFSARFYAENSMTFNKVKHATDLYEATNGHKPKSHDEYMQVIIDANMIKLPELRDGYEYWYDAKEGELMMRKPVAEGGQ